MLSWGEGKENGPLPVLPHHWRNLKNALMFMMNIFNAINI
jgi:hypothetical protein